MIALYGPREAPFVEKVARALALKGLPYRLIEPTDPSDYRRWSPVTGLLPVIELDGERIHDSTAILLRLDELHPDPPLVAADARTAAAQRRLESWADESLAWFWTRWQHIRRQEGERVAAAVDGESALGGRARPRSRLPRWLSRRPADSVRSPDARLERLVEELGRRVEDLDRQLSDRAFFYSDQISMGDLAVYSILKTTARDGIPGARHHLEQHPRMLDFMKRVEQATGGRGPFDSIESLT